MGAMRLRSILAAALCLAALPVLADPAPSALVRLTRDASAPGGACTGVLIAPDLVLTAGHCGPGRDAPARALFVQIGWDGTGFALTLRAATYDRHPDAPEPRALTARNVGRDLALIRLAEPLPPALATPLPIAADGPALPSEPLTLAGYRNAGPPGPQLSAPCDTAPLIDATLTAACRVVSGNSGGAVLRETPEGWELVAIISASGGGSAYAARPGAWVLQALAE
ncbi:MAG: Secreted trypsin-like serine protease [Rhodobacteraceae bacterium HLUCCA08]|nr:MAG: Secreted trypsin-like serine protease [Rhodobacteraceae bacterium HLUCCA08]